MGIANNYPFWSCVLDIRQFEALAALAREKHFTRAAQACNISQPTLSGRIQQLELEIGVPLVSREKRYQRLTPEGERILKWAHIILKNWDSLEQEVAQLRDAKRGLSGRIVLGGIPSALPMIPFLTKELNARHPNVEFSVLSLSSDEIVRSLADGSIAAGVTYIDNEPLENVLVTPLYTERYCLFVSETHPLAQRENISWCEAASKPLCLLTPSMQNRRIIDGAFREAKVRAMVRIETNSIINLCSNVRVLGIASIMPDCVMNVLGAEAGIMAVPLVEPKVAHRVGLVVTKSDLISPLIAALQRTATALSQGPICQTGRRAGPD